MQNLILTDIMKTGHHYFYGQYIDFADIPGQQIDVVNDYYLLPTDLGKYIRKIAIICSINPTYMQSKEYVQDLHSRVARLKQLGFKFIIASPWESRANVTHNDIIKNYADKAMLTWYGEYDWFWFYMYDKHCGTQFSFDHSDKKYDFLYLNKQSRPHRKKLYKKLSENGVLENSLHTRWPDRKLPAEYELPWAQDYPIYGMDQDIYEKPYNETNCSIVSETNDNDYDVFMTEKIWKPIIAQQVFVVHGNYLYLQKLREIGFKTFGNYFDESYDLEQDSNKRIDKIVSLCDKIRTKNWQDIYLQTKALRQHNFDTLFDREKLSKEINKTLNLFLEFADSSQVPS